MKFLVKTPNAEFIMHLSAIPTYRHLIWRKACHQIIVEMRSILQQGFTIVMEDHTSVGKLVSSVPNSSFSSDRFHEIPQGLFHKKRFKSLMTKRLMERHDCVKNFIVTKHAAISSKINILYTRRLGIIG
uniref:uncharacterized protein LOC117155570 n=1 Tax=Bombus vancouverensis nearcticus TaxID=2705178 RepID=UPI00143CA4D6|nr:uncharacterized protein LOC117155570 [Bombus vancouverensis nearcticus]XP_033187572.1 uncharacterized protein LOC117155570 [Bombus vancouverensis nearcticus]